MGELRVEGLEIQVDGRVLAGPLDFVVPSGEGLAVLGASGSGKTLLLRRLARLDGGPGRVTLDGSELDVRAWRAAVAWVPQTPPVFPGTPADLEQELASIQARQAEPAAGFADALGVAWDRPWHLLSGGERQRAHLALALAGRPRVLLLDEPTSALDAAAVEVVEGLVRGVTRVVVTHSEEQAERLASDVLRLG